MTKTLIVMRHGHAAGQSPTGDRGRPLRPRGLEVAREGGLALARAGLRPEIVLCSTATRARQTLAQVQVGLALGEVRELDGLYGAGLEGVLDLLAELDEGVESVMLVGHNPTLSELVVHLAGRGGDTGSLAPGDVVVLASKDAGWATRLPGQWRVTLRVGS